MYALILKAFIINGQIGSRLPFLKKKVSNDQKLERLELKYRSLIGMASYAWLSRGYDSVIRRMKILVCVSIDSLWVFVIKRR